MDGSTVHQSARASANFLSAAVDGDWDGAIPEMTWSVREVVAYISEVLLWYSTDLSAGPHELNTMDLKVRPTENPAALIETITACAAVLGTVVDGVPPGQRGWHPDITAYAAVLGTVVDGVPPGQRGWHPDGLADASGFAAMACDELLVHTWDAGHGLGLPFEPSEVLSQAVVHRIFPWAPTNTDTWDTLLWANGRRDLPGLGRQEHWHPYPAPLSEWDGSVGAARAGR